MDIIDPNLFNGACIFAAFPTNDCPINPSQIDIPNRLELLLADNFYGDLEAKTNAFLNNIRNHAITKGYPMHIVSEGSIFWMAFGTDRIIKASDIDVASMDHFKKLHQYLLDNGVYLGPSGYEVGFVSSAHTTKSLDQAATVICAGLDSVFS